MGGAVGSPPFPDFRGNSRLFAAMAKPSLPAAGFDDRNRAQGERCRKSPMTPFTYLHVLLSLVGIASGFVAVAGMVSGRQYGNWTAIFLASTAATSATGFLFPFHEFLPSHGVGIASLIVLAFAVYARYAARLAGTWRRTFVVTAVAALYLNVFVFIVQAFQKVPALKALAPRQSEPPFLFAQVVILVLFIALGIAASHGFKLPSRDPRAVGSG